MTVPIPVIPPDTRAPGYSGHIIDHNAISDVLVALATNLGVLQQQIAGSYVNATQQTGNYTLQATDQGTVVELNSASALTVTIPPASAAPLPVGALLWLFQLGAGTVTVAPGTGVTILSANGYLQLTGQYSEVKLRQRALNIWALTGSLI